MVIHVILLNHHDDDDDEDDVDDDDDDDDDTGDDDQENVDDEEDGDDDNDDDDDDRVVGEKCQETKCIHVFSYLSSFGINGYTKMSQYIRICKKYSCRYLFIYVFD